MSEEYKKYYDSLSFDSASISVAYLKIGLSIANTKKEKEDKLQKIEYLLNRFPELRIVQ